VQEDLIRQRRLDLPDTLLREVRLCLSCLPLRPRKDTTAGRITNEEFLAWGERARAKKQACDEGAISLDEFRDWLENS
jgi:hypothetical protein